jgi:hypothetical protein
MGVHVHIGSARTTGYRPTAVLASIRLCRRGTAGSAVSELPVCHDVQPPLTVILAQTRLLQQLARGESLQANEPGRSWPTSSRRPRALRSMTQDLVDASLHQSGRPMALLLAKTELVALTRQAVREHQLISDLH